MNFLKNNFYKTIISISILLVALSLAYYYFLYLPKINDNKLKKEIEIKQVIKECENFADSQSWKESSNRFLGESGRIFDQDQYNLLYKQCLRSKGINK